MIESMIRTSGEIDKIGEALSAAQAEFKPVLKNKINPHFKNAYADLSSQIDATREPLSKYGIFVLQTSPIIDGRLLVITRLLHKSGQWLESDVSLKLGQDTPQGSGSCITYGRRYGRAMALDLAAEEDDDGHQAQPIQVKASKNTSPGQQLLDRISTITSAFAKYNITSKELELYFKKPLNEWTINEVNESLKLGEDFRDGRKDKETFLEYIAIRDL